MEEYKPPCYGTKGWILVEILSVFDPPEYGDRFEIGDSYVDNANSTFWISEGVGLNYLLNDMLRPEEITEPGWWVLEDVVGTYTKGYWGFDDDWEEWEYGKVRRATQEEIDIYGVVHG